MINNSSEKEICYFSSGHRAQICSFGQNPAIQSSDIWKVGRRHPDLSTLSTICLFLQFNGENISGILCEQL